MADVDVDIREMVVTERAAGPHELPIASGVYFGMPEEEYHSIRALSSSGIRNLLISPLDYWINSPLNPEYKDEKTSAMVAGTAFHRRLLEPERFRQLYAARPTREDHPDALDGAEALRNECERLGIKKSGRISDLCDRILEVNPTARLWPVIEDGLMGELEGRILLKREVMADIERTARIVFAHQSAAKALTGGHAEVSIFWVDEEYGVPMKSRVDYLKVRALVDVKTFSNPLGKPIATAIAQTVANQRYDVQAVIYDDAVTQAKEMLRRLKLDALHGADAVDNDWLASFASCAHHAFAFLFIEQGPVTNVRVREFKPTMGMQGATTNMYWQSGYAGYREGVRRYAECMKRFGPDKPWIEDEPIRPFVDEDFPIWMFN